MKLVEYVYKTKNRMPKLFWPNWFQWEYLVLQVADKQSRMVWEMWRAFPLLEESIVLNTPRSHLANRERERNPSEPHKTCSQRQAQYTNQQQIYCGKNKQTNKQFLSEKQFGTDSRPG